MPAPGSGDHVPGGHTGDVNTPGHGLPGHGGDTHLPGHGAEPQTGPGGAGGIGNDALDHTGGAGDDATHGTHGPAHHADEAARHRAEYEAAREKPAEQRTADERAAISREHVRLANEDPAWRAEHYDKWGPGKRNSVDKLVDGQELPQLTEKPGGGWMAAHDMPHGPSETKFNPTPLGPDSAPEHRRPDLNEAARNRRLSLNLLNAEKAFDALPSTPIPIRSTRPPMTAEPRV
ncbi:hypothetical protein [Streptomyces sp. NPDC002521]